MTDTLTNEEICELMNWTPVTGVRDKAYIGAPDVTDTVGWNTPGGAYVKGTPNFSSLEQPWFDYVVPWLCKEKNLFSVAFTLFGKTLQCALGTENSYYGYDDKGSYVIAFNKALYQLREQL